MPINSPFSGSGVLYNQAGTSGSSPVGQQARNSPEGRQVYGQQGSDFAAQLQAILNQGQGQYNSDLAYQQQQGYLQSLSFQQQMDALRQQLGAAGGQAGVANANNQIEQGALARQGPLLDALLGLDKNALNRSLQSLIFGQEQGKARLGDQESALNQTGEQLDYTKLRNTQDVTSSAQNQEWGLRSDATARGAIGSQGMVRGYTNIQDQLAKSLGDIDKTYGWGKADLDRSRNELGRNRAELEKSGQLGYGELLDANQRLDLTDAEKRAQLADEKARLDNAAKSIGLSAAETAARINQQLSSLGIDQMINHNQVLKGMEDLRNNRLTPLAQAITALESQFGIDFNQLAGSP